MLQVCLTPLGGRGQLRCRKFLATARKMSYTSEPSFSPQMHLASSPQQRDARRPGCPPRLPPAEGIKVRVTAAKSPVTRPIRVVYR